MFPRSRYHRRETEEDVTLPPASLFPIKYLHRAIGGGNVVRGKLDGGRGEVSSSRLGNNEAFQRSPTSI